MEYLKIPKADIVPQDIRASKNTHTYEPPPNTGVQPTRNVWHLPKQPPRAFVLLGVGVSTCLFLLANDASELGERIFIHAKM